MEIFKALAELTNAKVTTNVVKENIYPELNGTMVVTKGVLSIEVNWYCRVYPMHKMEQFIVTDDLDWDTEKERIVINGLQVDDVYKFRQGLIDHGMQSVADSMNLSREEIRNAIINQLPNHKSYVQLFGDKKLYELVSDEDKKKAFIQKISEDITYRETDNRFKLYFGFVKENEEGVEVVLTNAEIIEEYYK